MRHIEDGINTESNINSTQNSNITYLTNRMTAFEGDLNTATEKANQALSVAQTSDQRTAAG